MHSRYRKNQKRCAYSNPSTTGNRSFAVGSNGSLLCTFQGGGGRGVISQPASIGHIDHELYRFYWMVFNAGVLEEKHMIRVYNIISQVSDIPSGRFSQMKIYSKRKSLINMVQSENLKVARMAAALLLLFRQRTFDSPFEVQKIEEIEVAEKYWEFAKNKVDNWGPRYIEGLALYKLKWAEMHQEWLDEIKHANTEELQNAWCKVIIEGGYYNDDDRNSLYKFLLNILEARDMFLKNIQSAVLQRLEKIAIEIEPLEFDENILNLPLSHL